MNETCEVTLKPRIMVVDDDMMIREMFELYLKKLGYQTSIHPGGLDALKSLEGFAPDIVITDIKMPGMSGLELLERIKIGAGSAEVIMITAHADTEAIIESLRMGAVDFLIKPFEMKDITRAINRAIERIAAWRAAAPDEESGGVLAIVNALLESSAEEKRRMTDIIHQRLTKIIIPLIEQVAEANRAGDMKKDLEFMA